MSTRRAVRQRGLLPTDIRVGQIISLKHREGFFLVLEVRGKRIKVKEVTVEPEQKRHVKQG